MKTETLLQKSIMDYFQLMENKGECYCVRTGSGAIKTEKGNWFKTGKKGCPDILCLIHTCFIGIEVKAPGGRQSDEQKQAQKKIEKLGGYYEIVRSLEDAKKVFE